MNRQLTLTGDRKIMNMPKVGTVLLFKNPLQLEEKPIKSMSRAIHYAHKVKIELAGPKPSNTGNLITYQLITVASGTIV
jgi:hypothetical protein